jgi:cytochrome b
MAAMQRLRVYHAFLALLVVFAFLSPDWGHVHSWLGYGVAVMILARLVMALTGAPQLGLMRFYPNFEGLKLKGALTHPAISRVLMLGIALSLLTVTGTGIAMDQGRSIGLAPARAGLAADAGPQSAAPRESYRGEEDEGGGEGEEEGEGGPLGEIHELAANLLLLFVGMHVTYLLVFKRPLAKFMLFLPREARKNADGPAPPTST